MGYGTGTALTSATLPAGASPRENATAGSAAETVTLYASALERAYKPHRRTGKPKKGHEVPLY